VISGLIQNVRIRVYQCMYVCSMYVCMYALLIECIYIDSDVSFVGAATSLSSFRISTSSAVVPADFARSV
jgi:hypothetical protein